MRDFIGDVLSVQIGRIAPLGSGEVPSGFVKRPIRGPVWAGAQGLDGDAQADRRVHGGREKAVYAYAATHYAAWRREFLLHEPRFCPGAFGENLTIADATEADLCVGDVHAIGGARLQVSQPRQPCFKLALRFDDARMPRAFVRSGRSGWYYRVLEAGMVAAGDAVRLVDRPNPQFAFEKFVAIANDGPIGEEDLALLAKAEGAPALLRRESRVKLRTQRLLQAS